MVQYVDPDAEPEGGATERDGCAQRRDEGASERRRRLQTDEFAVDLSDLEGRDEAAPGPEDLSSTYATGCEAASPGLIRRLHGYFGGDARRVHAAIDGYRGLYASVGAYVSQCLDSDGVAEWLLPYIDHEAIGRDWTLGGTIWTLPEELHDRQHERTPREGLTRGVHVFVG